MTRRKVSKIGEISARLDYIESLMAKANPKDLPCLNDT